MEDSEASFLDKGHYNANIKLTDKDKIIQNHQKLAETFNSIFKNAVFSLKLKIYIFVINDEHKNIQDPIEKINVKYQLQTSILIIKSNIKNTNNFRFKHVMILDIKNQIEDLNPNNATTHKIILPKILQQILNNAISSSEFPENLKLADFYQKDSLDKINYRPVSV